MRMHGEGGSREGWVKIDSEVPGSVHVEPTRREGGKASEVQRDTRVQRARPVAIESCLTKYFDDRLLSAHLATSGDLQLHSHSYHSKLTDIDKKIVKWAEQSGLRCVQIRTIFETKAQNNADKQQTQLDLIRTIDPSVQNP